MAFRCPWCGDEHESGEPGFRWPDAVFALSLPEDERAELQDGENEDVAVVRGACFVRGVALIPVTGRDVPLGIGFWVQISPDDFAAFEGEGRVGDGAVGARVANQCFFLAPTLGLEAKIVDAGPGMRPRILLTGDHPLARAQAAGVSEQVVHGWLASAAHDGEQEPVGEPFNASMKEHGYELVDPYEAGRVPVERDGAPAAGENAKVIVAFEASDETGAAKVLTAGWWITLDDVSRPGLWSGTLANRPRVPASLSQGSRLWIEPGHVIEYAPA